MEIVLSQPEPPLQCDTSPRRLPGVDTGSEEPGSPQRLPAIGTGSNEPGVSRAETSTETEEIVPLQASMNGFFMHRPRAGVYFVPIRSRARRQQRSYFITSRCSQGVREINEEAAAAKDDSLNYRAEQAV